MEALSRTHWRAELDILWADWGGYVNENGDTFDTRAWLVEHFNHPDTARISFLATLRLECCVNGFLLFYFLLFIMNGSWLDVLGVVSPASLMVHPCQHVEASINLSITLLPIRNVLILNRGKLKWLCKYFFAHVVFVLIFIGHLLLWLALTSFYDWSSDAPRDTSDFRLVTLDT